MVPLDSWKKQHHSCPHTSITFPGVLSCAHIPGTFQLEAGKQAGHRQGIWERPFTASVQRRARLVNHGDKCPAVSILQQLRSPRMSQQGGSLTAFPMEEGTLLTLGSRTAPWAGWDVAVNSVTAATRLCSHLQRETLSIE